MHNLTFLFNPPFFFFFLLVGYIPRAYAKPYVGRTQGKSISLIVELARDPQNIKELIVDRFFFFLSLGMYPGRKLSCFKRKYIYLSPSKPAKFPSMVSKSQLDTHLGR